MFRFEKDLVDAIIENKNTLFSDYVSDIRSPIDQNIEYMKEVDLGHGIADLVFVLSNNKISKGNQQLNNHDINIYHFCKKKFITHVDEIIDKTRLQKYKVYNSLKKLESEQYITNCNDNIIFKNEYRKYQKISIAVEAKLKDWKRALKQASRYRWFATESYVIMDGDFIRNAVENIQMFKDNSIGLGSISNSSKLEIILKPDRIMPYNKNMQVLLSEYLQFRT